MSAAREVTLGSLVGEHMLDAVDFGTCTGRYEDDAQTFSFRMDGVVYTAVENPSDGYRSMMDKVLASDDVMRNVFLPVKVTARMRETCDYGTAEVLQLIDAANRKVILEVGTDNTDDYYPWFVAKWTPENMAVNGGGA